MILDFLIFVPVFGTVAAVAGTVAAVASVAATGYSVYSASQSKKEAKRNAANSSSQLANQAGFANDQFAAMNGIAEEQFGMSMALQEEYIGFLKDSLIEFGNVAPGIAEDSANKSFGIAERTYNNIANVIEGIDAPSASAFMDEAKSLSMNDFQYRDAIKKGNLDFITGGTQDELRSAQQLNSSLAALDGNAFTGKMGEIMRSSMYGLKALTVGEASGTFANLSAQNLYSFSQQGLSNSLAMADFFSREGTVDPISPLQTAMDLEAANTAKVYNNAQLRIRNEENTGSSLLNIQGNLGNQLLDIEKVKTGLAQNIANSGLSYGTQAINNLGSQLMSSQAMLSENMFNLSNAEIAQGSVNQANQTNSNAAMVSAVSGAASTLQNYSNSRTQQDYYKALQQSQIAGYSSGGGMS